MSSARFTRSRRVVPAVVLSLLIAGEALAISWSPVLTVTEGSVYPGFQNRALAVGGSTAHLTYDTDAGTVAYRRGPTVGGSWGAAQALQASTASVYYFTQGIAASGTTVVIVYQGYNFDTGVTGIYIRRSLDGGLTWQPRQTISSYAFEAGPASAAVAINGALLVVAWTNPALGTVFIRRSPSSGVDWYARQPIGSTTFDPTGLGVRDGYVAVSVTGARIHAAWIPALAEDDFSGSSLVARRSVDSGTTFIPRQTVDSRDVDPYTAPAISTFGTGFLASYGLSDGRVIVARSGDGGSTYTRATVATPNATYAYYPGDIVLGSGGMARVTLHRYALATEEDRVIIRESSDGGAVWAAGTTAIGAAPVGKIESSIVATSTYTTIVMSAFTDSTIELYSRRGTN